MAKKNSIELKRLAGGCATKKTKGKFQCDDAYRSNNKDIELTTRSTMEIHFRMPKSITIELEEGSNGMSTKKKSRGKKPIGYILPNGSGCFKATIPTKRK